MARLSSTHSQTQSNRQNQPNQTKPKANKKTSSSKMRQKARKAYKTQIHSKTTQAKTPRRPRIPSILSTMSKNGRTQSCLGRLPACQNRPKPLFFGHHRLETRADRARSIAKAKIQFNGPNYEIGALFLEAMSSLMPSRFQEDNLSRELFGSPAGRRYIGLASGLAKRKTYCIAKKLENSVMAWRGLKKAQENTKLYRRPRAASSASKAGGRPSSTAPVTASGGAVSAAR